VRGAQPRTRGGAWPPAASTFTPPCTLTLPLQVPVKFVGVGETAEDLQAFDAETFADALFPKA
jgi:hypothetical protein